MYFLQIHETSDSNNIKNSIFFNKYHTKKDHHHCLEEPPSKRWSTNHNEQEKSMPSTSLINQNEEEKGTPIICIEETLTQLKRASFCTLFREQQKTLALFCSFSVEWHIQIERMSDDTNFFFLFGLWKSS